MAALSAEPGSLLLLLLVFLAGLGLGLVLGAGRRRLVRELLERQDALRQAETEALLDGVKLAFGDISTEALRRTGDEVLRLAQTGLAGERRLQAQQLAAERGELESRIGHVVGQLERMQALIREIERERAQRMGELGTRLDASGRSADELARTTRALAALLANSRARGQWGERLAEDLLERAGLVLNISWRRQMVLADGGRPDITFLLPEGRLLHMDVKFPLENWQRAQEAESEEARSRAEAAFLKDVRARIREVAARGYASGDDTLDIVLLFIPNERLASLILEQDPGLVDEALAQGVLPVSPSTLLAVLAILRRAAENFRLARAAREIAAELDGFRAAWSAWRADSERVGRQLEEAVQAFERLRIGRTRQLERQLAKLEAREAEPGPPEAHGGA